MHNVHQYPFDQVYANILLTKNRYISLYSAIVLTTVFLWVSHFKAQYQVFFCIWFWKLQRCQQQFLGTSHLALLAQHDIHQTRLFCPPLLWTWIPRCQSIRFHFVTTCCQEDFGHLHPPQCSCSKERAWVCGDLVGRPWETKETQLDHLWPQSFLTTRSSTIMLRYSFSF